MEIYYSSIPKGSTQLALFKAELLPHKATQIKPSADPEPKNLLQNTFNVSLQKQFLNANLPSSFKGTSQKLFWLFFLQKSKQRIYSVHRYWKRTTPPPQSIVFVRAAKNTRHLQKLVWWFLQQSIWYCKINPKITRARSSHDFLEYIIFQAIPLLFPDIPWTKAVDWFILQLIWAFDLTAGLNPWGKKFFVKGVRILLSLTFTSCNTCPASFNCSSKIKQKTCKHFILVTSKEFFPLLGRGAVYKGC